MFTRKMLVGISVVVFLVCLQMAGTASALETPGPFKIRGLFVSSADNLHFRVISNNPDLWLCSNGPNSSTDSNGSWAYINEADSGAKVKIAALMAAHAMSKTVYLVTEGVIIGSTTYCHIVEFSIYD